MKTTVKFEKCIINEEDEDENHKRYPIKNLVNNAIIIIMIKCKRYANNMVT